MKYIAFEGRRHKYVTDNKYRGDGSKADLTLRLRRGDANNRELFMVGVSQMSSRKYRICGN